MTRRIHTTLFAAAVAVAIPGLSTTAFAQDATDDSGQTIIEGQPGDATQGDRNQNQADRNQNQADRNQQASQNRQELGQQELQTWFEYVASANQYEIEAAKLAQQQAQDQKVKELARTIEQDHTEAMKKLQEQAQQANVQISDSPELKPVFQAQLDALKQKQGKEFDKAFVFNQDAGHRMAILEYSWAKDNVSNQPVQAYVTAVLPTLRQHHQRVHGEAQQVAGVTGGMQGMQGEAQTASGRMGGQDQGDSFDYSQDPAERYYQQRAQNLNYESELNRLASQRSQNQQVRDYAQQRGQQIERERQQLEQEAQQAGYDVSSNNVGMTRSQQSRLGELSQQQGADFDREYVFESTQQSVRQNLQDTYAARGSEISQSEGGQAAMQSAQRSLQSSAQRQQDLQRLLILVVDPQQPGQQPGQQGQQGQGGQQQGQGGQQQGQGQQPGQSSGQQPGQQPGQNRGNSGMGGDTGGSSDY